MSALQYIIAYAWIISGVIAIAVCFIRAFVNYERGNKQ